ncbi:MAG: class I SAM-dependent methyltransferase [Planctomycetota bacterium]
MSDRPESCPSGLRLHLGCGPTTPAGWLNVDYSLGARLGRIPLLGTLVRAAGLFATDWSRDIALHDLRRPFPWADGSAAVIYSSHTLEHLSREDGERFLRECRRVLGPGGVLRLVVPDLRAILDDLEKGCFEAVELLERLGVFAEQPGDGRLKRWLAPWVRFPHRCMYDGPSLLERMDAAGFDARLHPYGVSRIAGIEDVELEARAAGSLVAEGIARSGS